MKINFFKTIPPVIRNFFLRALLIFVLWKFIYHFFLLPARIPDETLTHITASSTAWLIAKKFPSDTIGFKKINNPLPKEIILKNNKKIIGIADGCNGLELFVLYIGFLMAYFINFKRLLSFSIIGVAIIFLLNILRTYALTLLNINQSSFTDLSHHYLFKLLVYGVMFLLWVKYTQTSNKHNE
jgi:exosortase family protein XrtF